MRIRWLSRLLSCAMTLGLGTIAAPTLVGCEGAQPPVALKVELRNEYVVLENGLRVVVNREPAWRTAVVDVRYRVGSREDPPGKEGLAHYVEHLMFRGTKDLPHGAFDDAIQETTGGRFNASTWADATEYHQHVDAAEVPAALFVEAQRLAYPFYELTEEEHLAERAVVENERRLNHSGSGEVVHAFVRESLYPPPHPYRRPTIGSAASIHALTREDARAFAARYYRPENATLVVTGNVDVAATLDTIARYFAKIPRGTVAPPLRVPPVPGVLAADARTRVVVPSVASSALLVVWPLPPASVTDPAVLRGARGYLGAFAEDSLVREEKLCDGVDFDLDERELATELWMECSRPTDDAKVLSTIGAALGNAANGARLWPIGRIRSSRMVSLVENVMDPEARASELQRSLALTGRADTMQLQLRAMQVVTTDDVAAFVTTHLAGRPRVIVKMEGQR